MIHIWSDDVVSGDTYDGAWSLDKKISGGMKLVYHSIEDGGIPWIYDPVAFLGITDGVSETFVSLANNIFDRIEPECIAKLEADLQAAMDAFYGGASVNIVYTGDLTQTFNVAFGIPMALQWASPGTTCQQVFDKVGAANTGLLTDHSLSARYATSRPETMEMFIDEGKGSNSTRGTDGGSIWVPAHDDEIVEQVFSLTGYSDTMTIRWTRLNIPQASCPMTLPWELMFADL